MSIMWISSRLTGSCETWIASIAMNWNHSMTKQITSYIEVTMCVMWSLHIMKHIVKHILIQK